MKIALLGYGKMGKVIDAIAQSRGHEIVARIGRNDDINQVSKAHVVIEFSTPDSVLNNINTCIDLGVPIVCGTTGWNDELSNVSYHVQEKKCGLVYASNFSLGVNLFFELNKKLARMMQKFDQYQVSMQEIHHTQKLDAPSGTAITLAEGIISNTNVQSWELGSEPQDHILPIEALREEDVKGTHIINYDSEVDQIQIKHTAHSRNGFALGAVIAAEWLMDKKGVFTMKDVLGL
ncbi:4-hydroxy-tetrahydrodipicolinate reductase [Nonlabens ponticola]|uniref:4-hydroxy-tetrahydrodipicolinate reductase n=1 Tax=Nonlabens ponticola TaxID=2496866 RepID=A0A3S9MYN0_9FLAO|nr:4-hydroxy-tetrahydrodipicolinate reductase [Nonlabens ponticola]AZQ44268.1 4-hydroxy-tetrahydrodipicolinate reductase [Nonlabens ponticola]